MALHGDVGSLSETPLHYADCCCTLSSQLIRALKHIFSAYSALVLSIGSGAGLLEHQLRNVEPVSNVHGVEVSSTINKYLGAEHLHAVGRTGGLCDLAQQATTWMFVYPRDFALIDRYLSAYGEGMVECCVFLLPRADVVEMDKVNWADDEWIRAEIVNCGLAAWETTLVYRRKILSRDRFAGIGGR